MRFLSVLTKCRYEQVWQIMTTRRKVSMKPLPCELACIGVDTIYSMTHPRYSVSMFNPLLDVVTLAAIPSARAACAGVMLMSTSKVD